MEFPHRAARYHIAGRSVVRRRLRCGRPRPSRQSSSGFERAVQFRIHEVTGENSLSSPARLSCVRLIRRQVDRDTNVYFRITFFPTLQFTKQGFRSFRRNGDRPSHISKVDCNGFASRRFDLHCSAAWKNRKGRGFEIIGAEDGLYRIYEPDRRFGRGLNDPIAGPVGGSEICNVPMSFKLVRAAPP